MLGVVGEAQLRVFEPEPPLLTDDVDFQDLLFQRLSINFFARF